MITNLYSMEARLVIVLACGVNLRKSLSKIYPKRISEKMLSSERSEMLL